MPHHARFHHQGNGRKSKSGDRWIRWSRPRRPSVGSDSGLVEKILTENSEVELDRSTHLATLRTSAAYERTMMAWIRTATSLITFGFAVYKFFDVQRDPGRANNDLIGPREFGMILVSIGLLSLVLAT